MLPVSTMLAEAVLFPGASYWLVRLGLPWVLRRFDRAVRNARYSLAPEYERPRYYTVDADQQVDLAARWPGWDGWYFFAIPDDPTVWARMIRGSVMTGLYGLDGVDATSKLPPGLSPYHAVEALMLVPMQQASTPGGGKTNRFLQTYLPKTSFLSMRPDELDVAIRDHANVQTPNSGPQVRITGHWPHYVLDWAAPQIGLAVRLNFEGDRLLWWADTPGIFTYFSALGRFEGELRCTPPAADSTETDGGHGTQIVPFRGQGAFEHGFARKPFGFDLLFKPVRALQRVLPNWRPIRYHYEVFVGADGICGGFMRAVGFGIPMRDLGGVYYGREYQPITHVRVQYLDDPPPDRMAGPRANAVRRFIEDGASGERPSAVRSNTKLRENGHPRR